MRLLAFADFVADHAADNRAADCSDSAATGDDRAGDGTGTGTDRGIAILSRHAATSTEAQQRGRHRGAEG